MRQTTGPRKSPGEKVVKDIKRATRNQYSSEEKRGGSVCLNSLGGLISGSAAGFYAAARSDWLK